MVVCSKPGTIWASSRRRSATSTSPVDDFKRALDIQPGARQTVLAYGESLRRSKNGKKAGEVYARWLTSDPNDFEMRARYSQVLREASDKD